MIKAQPYETGVTHDFSTASSPDKGPEGFDRSRSYSRYTGVAPSSVAAMILWQDADGCTPLIWAVHNNHYENAQLLLEAGAAWSEVRDAKGRTAKEHALSSKMRSLFTKPGLETVHLLWWCILDLDR